MLRSILLLLSLALLMMPSIAQEAIPSRYASVQDINYVDNGDERQVLDLYLPDETVAQPYPVLFMVHGGGFFAGDKADMSSIAQYYTEQGYAVVAPNYRLAPDVQFPSAHGDVFCAMAWTFDNADTYALDTDQITLLGESAGGNIVAYLGAVDDATAFMQECDLSYPTDPDFSSAILFYAPVDLLSCDCQMARRMASVYTGISYFAWEDETTIAEFMDISVVTWLDANDPPFYLLHGDIDFLVPLSEAQLFISDYEAVGGQAELTIFEGANHGFLTGFPSPLIDRSYQLIDDWLESL